MIISCACVQLYSYVATCENPFKFQWKICTVITNTFEIISCYFNKIFINDLPRNTVSIRLYTDDILMYSFESEHDHINKRVLSVICTLSFKWG